jgi:hypothetical protein
LLSTPARIEVISPRTLVAAWLAPVIWLTIGLALVMLDETLEALTVEEAVEAMLGKEDVARGEFVLLTIKAEVLGFRIKGNVPISLRIDELVVLDETPETLIVEAAAELVL